MNEQIETSCGICNQEIKGERFFIDVVLEAKKVKDEHVCGHQCQHCGVFVCFKCMERYFNKTNWKKTHCPICKSLFGPIALLLKIDLEDHTYSILVKRQKAFEKGKVTIPIGWFSIVIGVLSCYFGKGFSEFLNPIYANYLVFFGLLGILLGATPLVWRNSKVLIFQTINIVIIGVLISVFMLAFKKIHLSFLFFVCWAVYRQIKDYLALENRIKSWNSKNK